MGKKRSDKQLAVLAGVNAARWKPKIKEKENILLANAPTPPRTRTRAVTYVQRLEKTVDKQKTHILTSEASNHALESQNHALTDQLNVAHSHINELEQSQLETNARLFELRNDLSSAHSTIHEQNSVIKQKNQRINRLLFDKSILASRIACIKQELLQAVLSAEEARSQSKKLSTQTVKHIESLLFTISRLNAATSSLKSEKTGILADLKATRMREARAKSVIQKLRKELTTKSKWSGMKGRMFNSQYRTLAMAFTKAGCAQSRIGSLLARVGKVFGVNIKHSMSRRTVGRVITEAGIKVRIQLGHEMARAKGNIVLFSP